MAGHLVYSARPAGTRWAGHGGMRSTCLLFRTPLAPGSEVVFHARWSAGEAVMPLWREVRPVRTGGQPLSNSAEVAFR